MALSEDEYAVSTGGAAVAGEDTDEYEGEILDEDPIDTSENEDADDGNVAHAMYTRLPSVLKTGELQQFDLAVNSVYRFITCKRCGYAPTQTTMGIVKHIRHIFEGRLPSGAHEVISRTLASQQFVEPQELMSTMQGGVRVPIQAVEGLRVYHGHECNLCGYCCISNGTMAVHKSIMHRGDTIKWEKVLVQTLYGMRSRIFYFPVVLDEPGVGEEGRGRDEEVDRVMDMLRRIDETPVGTREGTAFSNMVGWSTDMALEDVEAWVSQLQVEGVSEDSLQEDVEAYLRRGVVAMRTLNPGALVALNTTRR
jgi:hypothetical protein